MIFLVTILQMTTSFPLQNECPNIVCSQVINVALSSDEQFQIQLLGDEAIGKDFR